MAFATLTIDMVARLARFEADLGRTRHIVERHAAGMQAAFARVGSVLGKLGVAGGVVGIGTALVREFRSAVNAADELGKVSQRVGVSVEALSALKHAAELSDVSFEELTIGLQQLAQNIDQGSDAFKRLALDARAFRSPDEALRAVAERFAAMEDGAAKTAIAMELFGRSGARLIPLLNGGAAGMRALEEEARRLGVTISAETARQAEEFNDQLTRLGATSRGVWTAIVKDALPALSSLAGGFSDATEASGGFLAGWRDIGLSTVRFGSIAGNIRELNEELAELRAHAKGGAFGELVDPVIEFRTRRATAQLEFLKKQQQREALESVRPGEIYDPRDFQARAARRRFEAAGREEVRPPRRRAAGAQADPAEQYLEQLERQKRSLQDLSAVDEALAELQDKRFAKITQAQRQAIVGRAKELDQLRQQQEFEDIIAEEQQRNRELSRAEAEESERARDKEASATERAIEQRGEEAEAIRRSIDPAREFRIEIERARALSEAGVINLDEFQAFEELMGKRMQDALDGTGKKLRQARSGFDEIRGAASSAAEEAIVRFESLGDVVQGFFDDITRIAARRGIVEPIINAIFGSDSGGGLFGGGGSFDISKLLGQVKGFFGFAGGGVMGALGPVPLRHYQAGGYVDRPTLFVAGEGSRREAIVPLPDGRAIPVKQLGGGGDVQVNMTVVTPDAGGFRRSQQQILADMQRQLTRAGRRA